MHLTAMWRYLAMRGDVHSKEVTLPEGDSFVAKQETVSRDNEK